MCQTCCQKSQKFHQQSPLSCQHSPSATAYGASSQTPIPLSWNLVGFTTEFTAPPLPVEGDIIWEVSLLSKGSGAKIPRSRDFCIIFRGGLEAQQIQKITPGHKFTKKIATSINEFIPRGAKNIKIPPEISKYRKNPGKFAKTSPKISGKI